MAPLIIISGPSGCGKSTLIERLLVERRWPLRLAVSATTRTPRPGERDGGNYHFWTRERFQKAVAEDAFLEWADVFGNYYGTLRTEVEPYLAKGEGVLLEIDVQGCKAVKRRCPEAVAIFVRTSSPAVLEERLRRRGTETEESLQKRLRGAASELAQAGGYDHQVVNDHLGSALAGVQAILKPLFERQSKNG